MVSIIIPYYNRPIKLQKTIRSILNQSYQDFEIIVVDDFSEKPPVLENDSRIVSIKNENNEGPGVSRNNGLDYAKGEFVAFLDSDDYWHQDFLKTCVEKMNSFQNKPAFVYVQTMHVANGETLKISNTNEPESEILPNLLINGRSWDTGSCLWNKSVIDATNKFIPSRNWEDYAFDVDAALVNNSIVGIKQPYFFCETIGDDKISNNKGVFVQVEKSKSVQYISNQLKDTAFINQRLYKKAVKNMVLSSVIGLLSVSKPQKSQAQKTINSLSGWGNLIELGLLKGYICLPVSISLPLLRRYREFVNRIK